MRIILSLLTIMALGNSAFAGPIPRVDHSSKSKSTQEWKPPLEIQKKESIVVAPTKK